MRSEKQTDRYPDQALSENFVVGPRASDFLPDKDGEAGDIDLIVDGAGHSQAGQPRLPLSDSSCASSI